MEENTAVSDQDEQPNHIPQPEQPSPVSGGHPKSSKKKRGFIIGMLVILLSAGSAATYYFLFKGDTAPVENQQASTYQPVSESGAKFYYTEDGNIDGGTTSPSRVVSYSPATGTKETIAELNLDNDRFMDASPAGTNQGVQVVGGGKKIFYKSVVPEPGFEEGGEGEPARESELISLFENNKETKLVELKVNMAETRTGVGIEDWVVSPDGSTVYYLASTPGKGDPDLHMVTVNDKKDVVLKEKLPGYQSDNRMRVLANGELVLYIFGAGYKLSEHKVVNGEYSTREMGEMGCACSLEWPQALSPDGKKILLEEVTSGTDPSDFSYYIMDVASTDTEKLAGPFTNKQWVASLWSPDSAWIAHDNGSFGTEIIKEESRIDLVKVSDKSSRALFDEGASDIHTTVLSWSQDGQYLAILHDNMIKFYDFTIDKVTENSIGPDGDLGVSNRSWGWL